MADQLSLRGGTTTEHATFTGANKEVTVDTTKKTLVVNDGATVGGHPLMRENASNSALALGSAGTPSLKFTGDTNTGIYSPGADQVSIATNGTERLRVDSAGQIEAVSLGTAAAPTFSFTGDPNTGIYSPGADQLAVATNGTGRLFVDASGNVGVGIAAPEGVFDVNRVADGAIGPILNIRNATATGSANTKGEIRFHQRDAVSNARYSAIGAGCADTFSRDGYLYFSTNSGTSAPTERMRLDSSGNVGIGTTSPTALLTVNGVGVTARFQSGAASDGRVEFAYNTTDVGYISANTANTFTLLARSGNSLILGSGGVEKARLDTSGRLLVGTSTSQSIPFPNTTAQSRQLQIEGSNYVGIGIVSNANAANGTRPATLTLSRTGSDSNNTTAVINSDDLGAVNFTGHDGTGHIQAGSVICQVDGTPGTNDMPGRLVFSTTADGASSPSERMRITSAGVLQIADAGNITVGTTTGTKIGTATTQKIGFYNATPVVQPTAVADATTAVDVITQLNDLLAKLRTLGIIAT